MTARNPAAISLAEALDRTPTLRRLAERMGESSARLAAIRARLPADLGALVAPGPYEDGRWCVLVPNTAAATKIRQLLPTLQATLEGAGLAVREIRVKVRRGR